MITGARSRFHGDSADRILYSTARREGVALVSKDRRIRDFAELDGAVTAIW